MPRITKFELQQSLAAMGAEVQALRVECSQLRADNERLSAENAKLLEAAAYEAKAAAEPRNEFPKGEFPFDPPRIPTPTVVREMPMSAFRLACLRAREQAMKTGRCTVVTKGA